MANNGRSRHELTQIIVEKKERIWGSGDRPYNPQRSAQNVISGTKGGKAPSMALLQWAANATDDQLIGAVSSGAKDSDYSFLYYK